jgi:hypothetical protein
MNKALSSIPGTRGNKEKKGTEKRDSFWYLFLQIDIRENSLLGSTISNSAEQIDPIQTKVC